MRSFVLTDFVFWITSMFHFCRSSESQLLLQSSAMLIFYLFWLNKCLLLFYSVHSYSSRSPCWETSWQYACPLLPQIFFSFFEKPLVRLSLVLVYAHLTDRSVSFFTQLSFHLFYPCTSLLEPLRDSQSLFIYLFLYDDISTTEVSQSNVQYVLRRFAQRKHPFIHWAAFRTFLYSIFCSFFLVVTYNDIQ